MKKRAHAIILLAALFFCQTLSAAERKVRLTLSAGPGLENPFAPLPLLETGLSLALAYPVSDKSNLFNTELSLLTGYQRTSIVSQMQSLRFGFGLRIFLNRFETLRPYFNHEITSQLVSISGRPSYARTYNVLLGLGLDFPLQSSSGKMETSSFFCGLDYAFYSIGHFEQKSRPVRLLWFSAGFSLRL